MTVNCLGLMFDVTIESLIDEIKEVIYVMVTEAEWMPLFCGHYELVHPGIQVYRDKSSKSGV